MKARWQYALLILAGLFQVCGIQDGHAQTLKAQQLSLDALVEQFLESHRNRWTDLNVPFEDGRIPTRPRRGGAIQAHPGNRHLDGTFNDLARVGRVQDGRQGHHHRDRSRPAQDGAGELQAGRGGGLHRSAIG